MKTIDFNFDNLGGISRLYAFSPDALRRIDRHPLTGLSRISLSEGATIIDLPVMGDVVFSEKQTMEEGGDTFNVQIIGFLPKQQDVLTIQQLERGDWLVIHQDANGDILLSGTPAIPLVFASDKTTGTPEGRNGNNFIFSATEPTPSTHIDPKAFYL